MPAVLPDAWVRGFHHCVVAIELCIRPPSDFASLSIGEGQTAAGDAGAGEAARYAHMEDTITQFGGSLAEFQ